MAEQQRVWAVERQVQLAQTAWWYPAWPPAYVGSVPRVYAYVPPRAIRRAYRYGYWPVPQPWPYVSLGVYAYPYSTWVGQPAGYQRIWIGPNGYVYRPYYGRPTWQPHQPTPAASPATPPARPAPRSPQPPSGVSPTEPPSRPLLNGPIPPGLEPIPAPPAEPPPE